MVPKHAATQALLTAGGRYRPYEMRALPCVDGCAWAILLNEAISRRAHLLVALVAVLAALALLGTLVGATLWFLDGADWVRAD